MKTKLIFGLGLLAILFAGCVVQTVNPLFTESEFVPYPSLVGAWTQKDDDKEEGWWVFKQDQKRYELTHTDEKGRKASFHIAAGRIGTNVFLDSSIHDPVPGVEMNGFAEAHLLPMHLFVKVTKTDAGFSLLAMDVEWLQKLLVENPKSIPHFLVDKHPVLTASTEELQKFVAKYADDNEVFKNEIKLVPKKAAK